MNHLNSYNYHKISVLLTSKSVNIFPSFAFLMHSERSALMDQSTFCEYDSCAGDQKFPVSCGTQKCFLWYPKVLIVGPKSSCGTRKLLWDSKSHQRTTYWTRGTHLTLKSYYFFKILSVPYPHLRLRFPSRLLPSHFLTNIFCISRTSHARHVI